VNTNIFTNRGAWHRWPIVNKSTSDAWVLVQFDR